MSVSRSSRAIAPGAPDFALHSLGWSAFQGLCAVVLREIFGQSVQAFADTRDAGRDGAFYGSWAQNPNHGGVDLPNGPFVLQCKHTKRADSTLSPSMLNEEFTKVKKLVASGACQSYILMTNARVTADSESRIREQLHDLGVLQPLVLGQSWINDCIAKSRELRMLVPRVYGLGDLSQILDERVYAQAEILMSYLDEELRTFVPTEAYHRAAESLNSCGFVLLLGEPAVGKSVIAATLSMSALDMWGCKLIKAQDAAMFVQHWNPNEPNQIFWIDDAFGSVRHEYELTAAWSRSLPTLMAAIQRGARIIMTSRDYIYREARPALKEYAFPLLKERQVVIDVARLSDQEREQIVYNHLKLGDQPIDFRRQVKPVLPSCAKAFPFRPEAARRLGRKAFTEHISPTDRAEVLRFMTHASDFLVDLYSQLGDDEIAALALVYCSGDQLESSLQIDESQRAVIERFGGTPPSVGKALKRFDNTFLRYATPPGSDGASVWTFRHPTLQEGFAAFIADQQDLLEIFITGLDLRTLVTRLDCSSVEHEGTLIRVPPRLYQQVANRLYQIAPYNSYAAGWLWWCGFLHKQASDDFLRIYLSEDHDTVRRLADFEGDYLQRSAPWAVVERIYRLGLLDPRDHDLLSEAIAVNTLMFRDNSIFREADFADILATIGRDHLMSKVKSAFIENFDNILDSWSQGWRDTIDRDTDPEDQFGTLFDILDELGNEFPQDQSVVQAVDSARDSLYEWIESIHESRQESESGGSYRYSSGLNTRTTHDSSTRSIFDDIDD